ncbi:MAG TPA: M48 family metalloprotease [Mycobacterium sp.]|nr:M48 family metalloprotease [Mycobacterium sp.]
MSPAICLLLYAGAVCVAAPRLLPRLTSAGAAPRLAVAVWLIVLISVLAAWIAAAMLLVSWIVSNWNRPGVALGACFTALRSAAVGQHGPALQLGLALATMVVAAFVTVIAARMGRMLLRARARARRHAISARIIGRRITGVDAMVVDTPEKAAYCLGGRRGTIVITSAALAALQQPLHLDAVLCHERAHLSGRHHMVLALTRALASSLPGIRIFTVAEQEVSRLLEMCADDTAARAHGTATMLGAILTLAGAGPIPAGALGTSTVGLSARVTRLAAPPRRRQQTWTRLLLSAFAAVLVAAPFLAAWAAARGLIACGPFLG